MHGSIRAPDGGSSPRMRGTPVAWQYTSTGRGIIPADAGNTNHHQCSIHMGRDHPRGCGEHTFVGDCHPNTDGSSPRMRGTRRCEGGMKRRAGIIPADAGNTYGWEWLAGNERDHPRGCGEHLVLIPIHCVVEGSSPRMRGTRFPPAWALWSAGIIPADAGNTCPWRRWPWHPRDHPRGCGEHKRRHGLSSALLGSSPRMRGTPAWRRAACRRGRIIPADAGNTRRRCRKCRRVRDHPRGCGEHHRRNHAARYGWGSSPRMRGTLALGHGFKSIERIIPADAGNTTKRAMSMP